MLCLIKKDRVQTGDSTYTYIKSYSYGHQDCCCILAWRHTHASDEKQQSSRYWTRHRQYWTRNKPSLEDEQFSFA